MAEPLVPSRFATTTPGDGGCSIPAEDESRTRTPATRNVPSRRARIGTRSGCRGARWSTSRVQAHKGCPAGRQRSSPQLAMTTASSGSTAATTDIATAAVVDHSLTRFQASKIEQQANAHEGEVPTLTPAQPLALRPSTPLAVTRDVVSSSPPCQPGHTAPTAMRLEKEFGHRKVPVSCSRR